MQSNQIEKILYKSLPVDVQAYLTKHDITADAWEQKLTKADQDKMLIHFALDPTARVAPLKSLPQETTPMKEFLTCKGTDNLILEYVGVTHEDKETSKNYSVSTTGSTLFEKGVAVIVLLGHVARGEQKEANAMLEKNPYLLLETGRVTDYACTEDRLHRRTLEGTAYRIALGAKDVKVHDHEECMVEMIRGHFKRLQLPDRTWEKEMNKQYEDQFPPGWKDKERVRAVNDSLALNTVFQALHDAVPQEDNTYEACEKACEPALKKFRQYLDNQIKGRLFKTGFHFNDWPLDEKEQKDVTYGIFGEALKLYVNNFAKFGGQWDSPKNRVFAEKIIGEHILDFAPANLAQAICYESF